MNDPGNFLLSFDAVYLLDMILKMKKILSIHINTLRPRQKSHYSVVDILNAFPWNMFLSFHVYNLIEKKSENPFDQYVWTVPIKQCDRN